MFCDTYSIKTAGSSRAQELAPSLLKELLLTHKAEMQGDVLAPQIATVAVISF